MSKNAIPSKKKVRKKLIKSLIKCYGKKYRNFTDDFWVTLKFKGGLFDVNLWWDDVGEIFYVSVYPLKWEYDMSHYGTDTDSILFFPFDENTASGGDSA